MEEQTLIWNKRGHKKIGGDSYWYKARAPKSKQTMKEIKGQVNRTTESAAQKRSGRECPVGKEEGSPWRDKKKDIVRIPCSIRE